MTKRDSSFANLESPRVLMSSPRRGQSVVEAHRDRAAASSEGASSSSNANHSWGLAHSRHETPGEPQHYGYAATVPSVPLPSANSASIPDEAYPLQSELSQNHRVLHSHIFKEVIPPPGSGRPSRLMITEVDRYGVERNRQAEFFFIELLVMSAPVMVDASTVGNKPPDLPITGVVFTTFPKYMMEILPGTHPGKITSNRLTMLKTQVRNSLTWKTTPR